VKVGEVLERLEIVPSSKLDGKSEETNMRYAIVIEKAPSNYAAYVPDLPGCIATGATVAETESLIREAIEFHLEGLKADGLPIPPASSQVEYIEVPA
jgi:predicted RNase H-like HicB family nuclease